MTDNTFLSADGTPNRQSFLQEFLSSGLPGRMLEEFKYTDLRSQIHEFPPLAREPSLKEAQAVAALGGAFSSCEVCTITFVNGWYVHELSDLKHLSEGVTIQAWNDDVKCCQEKQNFNISGTDEDVLWKLNRDIAQAGVHVRIPAGVHVARPLLVRYLSGQADCSCAHRCLVDVEEGASLTLLESIETQGNGVHFLNDVLEVRVGKGAQVTHVRWNDQNETSVVLSTFGCCLEEKAELKTWHVAKGGKISRHQIFCEYRGENAVAQVRGAQMLRGNQLIDTTLQMDHSKPGGVSRELFKTVVDEQAVGVFQGKIIVKPHAQKTDGQMMSAALLLSEKAAMNNKPELEIYADDVVCAHGATCGQLDAELLFYLMARGIPRKEAEALVLQAFLNESLEGIDSDCVVDELRAYIEQWLGERKV